MANFGDGSARWMEIFDGVLVCFGWHVLRLMVGSMEFCETVLGIGLAFCLSVLVIADDNVLDLPEPNVATQPGSVMLHGGGRVTEDAFDRFIDMAGGRNAKIVFVPCAGYRPSDYESEAEYLEEITDRYYGWASLAVDGHIASFQFLYTDDPEDADKEDFVKPLEEATGVWFSGGYQGRLNYRFVGDFPESTLFQDALRGVLERGGIVGGTSAGMAALPEIMTLWQDQEDELSPAAAVAAHGLGVFRGAIVEQHFDTIGGRLERFSGLLRDTDRLDRLSGRQGAGSRMVGLAVEEGAALLIRGDQLESLGVGSSHIFIRSKEWRALTWSELRSGELAKLVLDEDRHPSLSR